MQTITVEIPDVIWKSHDQNISAVKEKMRRGLMFEIATLTHKDTLQLPVEISKCFKASDRFIVWMDGDTLHLKRMKPSPLRLIEDAPYEEPLSLDEINQIVHEVRRQRRHGLCESLLTRISGFTVCYGEGEALSIAEVCGRGKS